MIKYLHNIDFQHLCQYTGIKHMNSILITGASRGIGRSIALAAARTGNYNKIVLNCHRNAALLSQVHDEVNALLNSSDHIDDPVCITSVGDISDISYVQSLRKQAGRIDVLINNSAISLTGLLIDMSPEQWNLIVNTNITSLYNTCHTFIPDMISAKKGRIINISSVWGLVGASCEVAYSATKGAVNSFTKALAKELAPSNIQVNALALGIVDTEMNSHLSSEDIADIKEEIPSGYILSPDEAASAVIKLLEMPDYFTGEIVKLDGAWQ